MICWKLFFLKHLVTFWITRQPRQFCRSKKVTENVTTTSSTFLEDMWIKETICISFVKNISCSLSMCYSPPPLEDEEDNEEVEEEEGEADDEGDGDRELALDVQVGCERGENAAFLPS